MYDSLILHRAQVTELDLLKGMETQTFYSLINSHLQRRKKKFIFSLSLTCSPVLLPNKNLEKNIFLPFRGGESGCFFLCAEKYYRGGGFTGFYSKPVKQITSGPNPGFSSFFLSIGYCWMEVQNQHCLGSTKLPLFGVCYFINRLLSTKVQDQPLISMNSSVLASPCST